MKILRFVELTFTWNHLTQVTGNYERELLRGQRYVKTLAR